MREREAGRKGVRNEQHRQRRDRPTEGGRLGHRQGHERNDDAEVLHVGRSRQEAGGPEQGGDAGRERHAAAQEQKGCDRQHEETRPVRTRE